jgi:hypothetical protein
MREGELPLTPALHYLILMILITTSDGNLEVVQSTSINTRVPVKDIIFIDTCLRCYNNNN